MDNSLVDTIKNNCEPVLDINNTKFNDEELVDIDLSGSIFYQVDFKSINFKNVDLTGSSFIECSFNQCNVEKTSLHKSEISDCSINECRILNSILTKTELYDINFSNTILHFVNFGWSYMDKCIFINTELKSFTLEGATFCDIQLSKTSFSEASLNINFPLKVYIKKECFEISDRSGLSSIIAKIIESNNSVSNELS
jgi:uncharacterized protein YjbI with pentapeptide repeats